jgi:acetyltransferase-like isoleucine patch superfamily enzyme
MNRLRAERYLDAKGRGYRFISYVSSRLSSLEEPRIGENCFILDGQLLNLDVSIGNNVTMWSGNHVGDRTVIGDHVWIASHVSLAGDVTVGDGCFLGVNASVSNGVRLGARTFVGAQTIVDKDTPADAVFVSQPARSVPLSSEKFLAMLRLT